MLPYCACRCRNRMQWLPRGLLTVVQSTCAKPAVRPHRTERLADRASLWTRCAGRSTAGLLFFLVITWQDGAGKKLIKNIEVVQNKFHSQHKPVYMADALYNNTTTMSKPFPRIKAVRAYVFPHQSTVTHLHSLQPWLMAVICQLS